MTDKQVESLRTEKTKNRTNGNSRTEKYIITKKKIKIMWISSKETFDSNEKEKFDKSVEII